MALLKIENVKLSGMAACVPKNVVSNADIPNVGGVSYGNEDFIRTTGVRERRIDNTFTASDLCYEAAKRLIVDLGWEKNEIEALIFVSQTRDYILPSTSCILQNRLGLSKDCFCEDICLGCSGWVYSLSTISSVMQNGNIRKALLLVGDTGIYNPSDDLLFGSAGTATAISYEVSASPMYFNLGTDGSGYDAIIIPHGGAKHPFCEKSFDTFEVEGHEYNYLQSQMKGMDVFAFGITTAPKSIKCLADYYGLDYQSVDYLVLHQANKKMNDMIIKKLKFNPLKAPVSLDEFGNTSCASIPFTIVSRLGNILSDGHYTILACGFGVGLSWGTVHFETENIVISNLIEL